MTTTKIVTFTGSKGGVGKTTILFNFASWLASQNKKVLLIDADFQASLSSTFNVITNQNTLLDVFIGSQPEVRQVAENIDLIPASPNLDQVETLIQGKMFREYVLLNWMNKNKDVIYSYDYVLIDTHPEFSMLTKNTIAVSDAVIVPLEPSEYGFTQLKNQFELRMAEFREASIDPRTNASDIDAKVYFIGSKARSTTTSSRLFKEELESIPNNIGVIKFSEIMPTSTFTKVAVTNMTADKLRSYKGYKDHLVEEFTKLTQTIDNI
ncbi:chromosome partitioning protein ParA [Weissella oryzae SG25]|uniref:Chromosome partitioning protein ParA n=1 Tax=Weissella oryzae (strain DSM 25784 / JCM 18191 / LMG 30913 / SG25) TaxID=1329250 RepID=A0A069CUY4_WEIOS|nr:AAA family ATPase [Weissella oryzae]GAK31053.1 chromosome partitioning protein ParA [Weissella oryzae SG25]